MSRRSVDHRVRKTLAPHKLNAERDGEAPEGQTLVLTWLTVPDDAMTTVVVSGSWHIVVKEVLLIGTDRVQVAGHHERRDGTAGVWRQAIEDRSWLAEQLEVVPSWRQAVADHDSLTSRALIADRVRLQGGLS